MQKLLLYNMELFIVVDCGDLPDPRNGDVKISKSTFGGVALHSCDTGYFLVGNVKRVCQANGKWSGAAPICKSNPLVYSNT